MSYYLSIPYLTWDAMLCMTKVEFELILDPEMFIFLEKGMKGGFFYTSNRYRKANNEYLKSYNPKQKLEHIILRRK